MPTVFSIFCALLSTAALSLAAPPIPHPRLLLTTDRLSATRAFISNNTQAAAYFSALLEQGNYVLGLPPLARPPLNASDILSAARAVLQRIYVVGLLFQLTGNTTWAERTRLELVNCTQWHDWDISKHALDTGELCHATAVGLDWTYDYLSLPEHAADKATIISGMVSLGMVPFREAYNGSHPGWWAINPSNWAVVTNGGAGLAALALDGEAGVPAWVSAEVLPSAIAGVQSSATRPGPPTHDDGTGDGYVADGSWWEGPIYHGYASRYFVPFATGLWTATGADAGLWSIPGATAAAHYQMDAMDSELRYFNWADAEEGQETLCPLLQAASLASDGAAAWTIRDRLDRTPPPLADIDSSASSMEYATCLIYFTHEAYPRKKLAFLRSSRTAPNATFVGLKAANCSWNHGDLDAGQFVYSAGGVRWAVDLGSDNYGLPGYFGPLEKRFSYYRKNSLGHNVLTFGGLTQSFAACEGASTTFLTAFDSSDGAVIDAPGVPPPENCSLSGGAVAACAGLNLTGAYAGQGVSEVTRTLEFLADRATLRVADRWATSAVAPPPNATWVLHTFTSVESHGAWALMTSPGAPLAVNVSLAPLEPACCSGGSGCAFVAVPVRLAPPQYSSVGLTRLEVTVDPSLCSGLDVTLTPVAV